MTLPKKCKGRRPPLGVRVGVPAAAAGAAVVVAAAVAVAAALSRRNAPPRPAERPPRVDDPVL